MNKAISIELRLKRWILSILCIVFVAFVGGASGHAQSMLLKKDKIDKIQTLLEVGALDGWLLADKGGQNSTALHTVSPVGTMSRPWFFLIPVEGAPLLLVHQNDQVAFAHITTVKWTYNNDSDLPRLVAGMLKGKKSVAMEYAPKSGIPKLTQIDEALADLVREAGVSITSSANLVQHIKSVWGPEGKISHHVATHHIKKSFEEATLYLIDALKNKTPISEWMVHEYIKERLLIRGIENTTIVVASGVNTANSWHTNTPAQSRTIGKGDLLIFDVGGKKSGTPQAMFARMSWSLFIGDAVPPRMARAFDTVVKAREQAIQFVNGRIAKRRGIKGFEVDQKIRQVLKKEGVSDRFSHSSGHSMDTELRGDGANLDDYNVRDTRQLVRDTGVAVEPGLYWPNDFGVRSVVGAHFGKRAFNLTSPLQTSIQLLVTH